MVRGFLSYPKLCGTAIVAHSGIEGQEWDLGATRSARASYGDTGFILTSVSHSLQKCTTPSQFRIHVLHGGNVARCRIYLFGMGAVYFECTATCSKYKLSLKEILQIVNNS